jgi:predicted cupin superfamily sugar epimerase
MENLIQEIIDQLELKPHPEGGFFRETYRSEGRISADQLRDEFKGAHNYSTCIYFLLTSGNFSAFHRIKQDEIWHFYSGSPIHLHSISKDGVYHKVRIGNRLEKGEVPQYVVPSGNWFAAEVSDSNAYALVGCTVSPGFSFDDFEMKPRKELIALFPNHRAIITRLTKQ